MKGLSFSEIETKIGRCITDEEFKTVVLTEAPYRRTIVVNGELYCYEV